MVQMKLDSTGVDPNKSNGFEPYEGPLPRPGTYAAIIKSCKVRISQAGNPYFNVLFEFADQQTPEKQVFRGYPLWDKIVPGDSDIQTERVGKFLNAVCGKVKANVTHDEVTDGGTVQKIGGKEPVGTKCKVVVNRGSYNGEATAELRDLFPWPKDQDWPEGSPEGDDEDVEIEEEEDEEESEDEELEEDDSDEEEEEDDEEDEEEEDDEDEMESRRAELSEMTRTALKAELKELDSEAKVLKKHKDEDIVEMILGLEFEEEDDEEGGDDEPPF